MKRTILFIATLLFCISCFAQENSPKRPPILGIGSVTIRLTERAGFDFYSTTLGLQATTTACIAGCWSHLPVSSHQRLELRYGKGLLKQPEGDNLQKPVALPNPQTAESSNVPQVTFETSDVEALHRYLESRGLHPGEIFSVDPNGDNPQFFVQDPEGHDIGFIRFKGTEGYQPAHAVSDHVIHAGFVVHDRGAEDKFYKDILGFRVYWHGGMKEGEDNWVDMQVPDGTDWLEYMLKVPDNATHKQLGVMNHIALGVPDIHAAERQLINNGWKGTEEPKIGRDGKWQLNLYDPDETRVELMEFKPTKEPCCSPYAGPHPGP
jgi:catechol 2,3-dioxygenase-like lactoylglutathione lyase family enzyme